MIPTASIAAWRHHAPWALSGQWDPDVALDRVLTEFVARVPGERWAGAGE